MQDWMRKHRRLIMFFVLIFICIPFIFMFGMPSGSNPRQAPEDSVVATVGGVPIMESEFRRQLDATAGARRGQDGERPSYQELDKDGTVQRVLENMVDSALIKLQEQQRGLTVDESVLSDQMRQWDMFKDEEGNFNHEAWNEWVASVSKWDEIYADMNESVARQVFLNTVMASGNRVSSGKLEEELKDNHTKLRVKFAKVEPPLEPAPEELRAHYDANPEKYRLPEQVRAEFVALSLAPPLPEIAPQLVERARQGEDFAELAKAYSNLTAPEGGEMGWRTEEEFMAPHLQPLFKLLPGEISDPVAGPTGYFIYKNEEERVNEETGAREVLGRQIVLNVQLDASERTARESRADAIAARLQKGEDLQAVAAEEGLEVKQTNFFDRTANEIENVDASDVVQFRTQVVSEKDKPWTPVKGRNNILLAHVLESREGDLPPYEEVLDKARENVIAEKKQTEEYKARVAEYSEKLKAEMKTLVDMNTIFPELNATIGETTEPFTPKDSLFQYQLYVQGAEIHKAFRDKEPGSIAGPLSGFFGESWFFELIERTPPTEEELSGLEGEREEAKNRLVQTRKYEIMTDFTKDLRERMLANVSYQQNTEVLDRILGRNLTAEEAAAEGESAPGSSTVEGEPTSAEGASQEQTDASAADPVASEGAAPVSVDTGESDAADAETETDDSGETAAGDVAEEDSAVPEAASETPEE